ncbi:ester cyclase [Haloferax larsenii]|uniref:Ester cyclase n=1 Tax=Haloferax larsenii TaxID=302484 RepID=A0ABY5RA12_HALLR|nr:ester cyclase [Haloferax larsenii]UVE49147.1 ester cyclase [Haloferax larsenii]
MAATSPAETNKALVRRLYEEGINEKNDDLMLETYASDYVIHGAPGTEDGLTGRDTLAQYIQGVLEAFPDMTATIEAMVAADDLVAVRLNYTGTHEGEYMGISATGKAASWDGMVLFRIEDGQIAETWPAVDVLSLLQQLGAVEIPDL